MKKIFLIVFLLIPSLAHADFWYIVNQNTGIVSSKQNGKPNEDLLNSDGYFSIKSKEDIDLSVIEYRNGKVFTHIQTTKELKDLQDAAIDRQAKADAKASGIAKLKALGLSDNEINSLVH